MKDLESTNEYVPYKVLARQTLEALEEIVSVWMARGYAPTGGVTINDVQTSIWYMQVVVLQPYDSL